MLEGFVPDKSKSQSNSAAVFKGENYRITVLSERLVRLEYSVNGNFNDNLTTLVKNRNFSVPNFKVEQDSKYIVISTKYFMLQYLKNKPFLGPKFAPDSNLKINLLNTDKMWFYGHVEARNFYGGAISLDNYQGKVSLDKGLYSTDGFVSLDDSGNMEIDDDGFLKEPDPNKVDIYVFMYKRDFGLCLKDYYTLTGYPYMPPRYAFGVWWNREKIYNFLDTKELVNSFNKHQVPLSILLLSEFWHIKDKENYNLHKTGFSFNRDLFPNPKEFVDFMHSKGVFVGLNMDPIEGIRKEEDRYLNFSQELNIVDGITIPFNVFDKKFMSLYIRHMIDSFLELGIDVFWLDYQKDLKSLQALCYYYNQAFIKSSNRSILFTRSPLVAPHTSGILYSGETIVSWDTLKYLPFYNSLASNKGVAWWSHDVGGYKDGIEDSELYLRYIQFSCFSPIFRFSAKRGAYYKREPWFWDVKTFTIAREYIYLRQRLIPYIYTEGINYCKTGKPLIQPIYYSYPEIYDEPNYRNEYYFGKELFIAPITKPKDVTMNRSIERIYLPKGIWYDFKTGKKFVGDKRYVAFYKEDEYPIFVQEGGIIPLANLNGEDINNFLPPKSMEINIFPGKSNMYKLYEDDGVTKLYDKGYYIVTAIDYNYMQNNYTVIIHPIEGKTEIIPRFRDYKIRFRNTRTADSVEIYLNNDKDTLEYKSYTDENDFVVEIKNVDTTKQLTVNCKGKDIEINAVRIINEDINSIITDLKISTKLKEEIASIIFSDIDVKLKRIRIKKLKGLDKRFIRMFIKLLEYVAEI